MRSALIVTILLSALVLAAPPPAPSNQSITLHSHPKRMLSVLEEVQVISDSALMYKIFIGASRAEAVIGGGETLARLGAGIKLLGGVYEYENIDQFRNAMLRRYREQGPIIFEMLLVPVVHAGQMIQIEQLQHMYAKYHVQFGADGFEVTLEALRHMQQVKRRYDIDKIEQRAQEVKAGLKMMHQVDFTQWDDKYTFAMRRRLAEGFSYVQEFKELFADEDKSIPTGFLTMASRPHASKDQGELQVAQCCVKLDQRCLEINQKHLSDSQTRLKLAEDRLKEAQRCLEWETHCVLVDQLLLAAMARHYRAAKLQLEADKVLLGIVGKPLNLAEAEMHPYITTWDEAFHSETEMRSNIGLQALEDYDPMRSDYEAGAEVNRFITRQASKKDVDEEELAIKREEYLEALEAKEYEVIISVKEEKMAVLQ